MYEEIFSAHTTNENERRGKEGGLRPCKNSPKWKELVDKVNSELVSEIQNDPTEAIEFCKERYGMSFVGSYQDAVVENTKECVYRNNDVSLFARINFVRDFSSSKGLIKGFKGIDLVVAKGRNEETICKMTLEEARHITTVINRLCYVLDHKLC